MKVKFRCIECSRKTYLYCTSYKAVHKLVKLRNRDHEYVCGFCSPLNGGFIIEEV